MRARREAGLCVGIDQGKNMDCVTGYIRDQKLVIVGIHQLAGWNEVDNLMRGARGVGRVRPEPERRASEEWCARWLAWRSGRTTRRDGADVCGDHKTSIVQIAHVAAVDLLLNRIRGARRLEVFDGTMVSKLIRHWRSVNVVLREVEEGLVRAARGKDG